MFTRGPYNLKNATRLSTRAGWPSIVYRTVIRLRNAQEREVSKGIRCRAIEQSDDRGLIELNWPVVLVFTTSWLVGLRLLCSRYNSRARTSSLIDHPSVEGVGPRVSHRSLLSSDWNHSTADIPRTHLPWATLSRLCPNSAYRSFLV